MSGFLQRKELHGRLSSSPLSQLAFPRQNSRFPLGGTLKSVSGNKPNLCRPAYPHTSLTSSNQTTYAPSRKLERAVNPHPVEPEALSLHSESHTLPVNTGLACWKWIIYREVSSFVRIWILTSCHIWQWHPRAIKLCHKSVHILQLFCYV